MKNKQTEEIIKLVSPHWKGLHFSHTQLDQFIELFLGAKPKYILETGFGTGTSSLTMCCASKIANAPEEAPIIAISVSLQEGLFNGVGDGAQRYLEENFNFKLTIGRSDEDLTTSIFDESYPKGIDFFFVDGGHSYNECLGDLNAGFPYMNKGGTIAIDDYHSLARPLEDVDRAVDDFYAANVAQLGKEFVQLSDGKGVCLLKKL